jgi:hypothetical protein
MSDTQPVVRNDRPYHNMSGLIYFQLLSICFKVFLPSDGIEPRLPKSFLLCFLSIMSKISFFSPPTPTSQFLLIVTC